MVIRPYGSTRLFRPGRARGEGGEGFAAPVAQDAGHVTPVGERHEPEGQVGMARVFGAKLPFDRVVHAQESFLPREELTDVPGGDVARKTAAEEKL